MGVGDQIRLSLAEKIETKIRRLKGRSRMDKVRSLVQRRTDWNGQ